MTDRTWENAIWTKGKMDSRIIGDTCTKEKCQTITLQVPMQINLNFQIFLGNTEKQDINSLHAILFKNTYTIISSNESIQIRPNVKILLLFKYISGTTLKVFICLILTTNL